MSDANRTQMLNSDPNRTVMSGAPVLDPNKTMMGNAPTINATVTIKPIQCPVCKTFNPGGVKFCVECGLIFDRALPADAFGAPAVQLPILLESTGREHPLRAGSTVIGREADIIIADSKVSRKHAQITNANGLIEIEDLGSSNGTKVNGNTVAPGNKIVLTGGEKISFAGVEMTFQVPGSTGTNSTQAFGGNKTAAISATPRKEVSPATLCWGDQEFALKPGLNTFGRKSENDVSIADPYISGKHGTIEITDQGIFITDIGSTNGMSLNDARLSPNMRTVMTQEDTIKIGAIELKIRLNA